MFVCVCPPDYLPSCTHDASKKISCRLGHLFLFNVNVRHPQPLCPHQEIIGGSLQNLKSFQCNQNQRGKALSNIISLAQEPKSLLQRDKVEPTDVVLSFSAEKSPSEKKLWTICEPLLNNALAPKF